MEPVDVGAIAKANGKFAIYEDPAGAFRGHYRTTYTAADEFSRNFTVEVVNGEAVVPADKFARWCLEQFVASVEVKEPSGEWTRYPFAWGLTETIADLAFGGFLVGLAYVVASTVVGRAAANLDAVKKTSLTSSGNSTSAGTPQGNPGSTT